MLNARIKSVLISLILLGVFLINTQYTDADIFAERSVTKNKFSAKTLNFFARNTVNNSATNYLYKTLDILPGGYDLAAVKIKRDGNVNFKYHLKVTKTNGEDELCNNLNLQVLKRNFTQIFSDKLINLAIDSQINNDNPEDWIFFLSFDQNDIALKNKICEFNFDFKTYRNDPNEQGGIFAQRIITNIVSSGNW